MPGYAVNAQFSDLWERPRLPPTLSLTRTRASALQEKTKQKTEKQQQQKTLCVRKHIMTPEVQVLWWTLCPPLFECVGEKTFYLDYSLSRGTLIMPCAGVFDCVCVCVCAGLFWRSDVTAVAVCSCKKHEHSWVVSVFVLLGCVFVFPPRIMRVHV